MLLRCVAGPCWEDSITSTNGPREFCRPTGGTVSGKACVRNVTNGCRNQSVIRLQLMPFSSRVIGENR